MLKSDPIDDLEQTASPEANDGTNLRERQTIKRDAILSVIIDAFSSLIRTNPAQAAASVSYYTLFSIFPMILLMVVILSYFLEMTVIQQEIVNMLNRIIPGSERFVVENLQSILSRRTATSITASITLLWSGSGAFNGIISNIHKAWPESRGRGYFVNRAFAMFGIILIVLVLAALVMSSVVVNISTVVPVIEINVDISLIFQVLLTVVVNYFLPIILVYYACFLLYYYVPAVSVDRFAANFGAWMTSLLIRLFSSIFTYYVLSPFNRYDVIYGSLTVIMLLLLYVFFSTYIIMFSAHLVSAITHYKEKKGIPFSQHLSKRVKKTALEKPSAFEKKSKSSGQISMAARLKARCSGFFCRMRLAWLSLIQKIRRRLIRIADTKPRIKRRLQALRQDQRWLVVKETIKDFFNSLFRWK